MFDTPFHFKLLDALAKPPMRSSDGAVGFDLFACQRVCIPRLRLDAAGEPVAGYAKVSTGVALELPPISWEDRMAVEAQVRGRSGLAFSHNIVTHTGTIDPDYRGEIGVKLFNFGHEPYTVEVGDRVAQLVFAPVLIPVLHRVSELSSTARGASGYGSTGR